MKKKRQHAPAVQWDDSDLVFVERAEETARKRAWRRETEGGREAENRDHQVTSSFKKKKAFAVRTCPSFSCHE